MKFLISLAMFIAASTMCAHAATTPKIISHVILDSSTTATGQAIVLPQGSVRVISSIFVIPVGYTAGFHKHPYPRMSYVLAGRLDVEDQHGTTRHYKAGDFLIETVNGWHRPHVVGNVPVRLLVIDEQPAAASTNTINQ